MELVMGLPHLGILVGLQSEATGCRTTYPGEAPRRMYRNWRPLRRRNRHIRGWHALRSEGRGREIENGGGGRATPSSRRLGCPGQSAAVSRKEGY